jgi:hypothetical protein
MRTSLASLILANLVPLLGALLLDWDIRQVLAVYWAESGIVGLSAIFKMASCRGKLELDRRPPPLLVLRILFIPFFIVHFGAFMFGHGLFVLALTGGLRDASLQGVASTLVSVGLDMPLALVVLMISHGISFVKNYVGRQEYRTLSIPEAMVMPYGRIIVMHVTLLAGGFAVILLGEGRVLLASLVLLKTAADARQHVREHSITAGLKTAEA